MPKPKKTQPKKTDSAPEQPIEERIDAMQQVDGKDYDLQSSIQVSQKKSLNEIWGRKFSKFKAASPEEYLARLRKMTKLDLQQECTRVDLMPLDNRELMIERLVKQCRISIAAANTSSLQPQKITVSEKSRHILAKTGTSMV